MKEKKKRGGKERRGGGGGVVWEPAPLTMRKGLVPRLEGEEEGEKERKIVG